MSTKRTYTREFDDLTACSLTPDESERTADYWFLVRAESMAHTAFATRHGLDRWLRERGLSLASELPEAGQSGHARIIGTYCVCSHLTYATFGAIEPTMVTAQMDNGQYTLGWIDADPAGVRTVHHLNCNVRTRTVFDYATARAMLN